ncbi:MAG TPA: HAD-IIA family hydrolase [Steroidobacteraceae bacterium]
MRKAKSGARAQKVRSVSLAISARLRAVRGFVFDLDGTLVLGDRHNTGLRVLPGAIELLEYLVRHGVPYVILTNGTVRTPHQYADKVRMTGLPLPDERAMLTPSSVAADYLARRKFKRVLALGPEGVWGPLRDAGLEIVHSPERAAVDAVFVGWYREFTMDDLEAACHAVWQGAKLFTSSLSPFFATAEGKAIGTSRAICAVITSLTGQRATVLGKPSLEALKSAARRMQLATADLAVVGDDPALEVPMAHRGGAVAIAVATGIGKFEDYAQLPRERRPHLAVENVAELLREYRTG